MTQSKGLFILIAGANASGKSTVIKPKYVKGRVKHYADPDRIALDDHDFPITEKDILSEEAREALVANKPDKFAIKCVDDWLRSEHHRVAGIATESNLVSIRDFRKFREAKQHSMKTELYFVGLPLQTAKDRELKRVANGEQDKIDHEELQRRYKKGLHKIQEYMRSGNVDIIMIYDNSHAKGEEQLLVHIEDSKLVYVHSGLPEWFTLTNIEIPKT